MTFINNFLPLAFANRWVIAGEWAACPALAEDMDVWVLNHDPINARQAILTFLAMTPWRNFRYTEESLSSTLEPSGRYEGVDIRIEKVAELVWTGDGLPPKPIHLVVTDAPCPEALISAFDISTHAVAIGPMGQVYTHEEFTHPGEAMRLLRANVNTPTRVDRICARFGLDKPILPEVLS